jgi:hypothetical protein
MITWFAWHALFEGIFLMLTFSLLSIVPSSHVCDNNSHVYSPSKHGSRVLRESEIDFISFSTFLPGLRFAFMSAVSQRRTLHFYEMRINEILKF